METKTTCQICEREIKANTGVIAHHGYQRPDRGSGWQTASCWGARKLPYEVSCDQIQPCIDHIVAYIEMQTKRRKDMLKNPPEKMTRVNMYRPSVDYPRPENFDPKQCLEQGSFGGSQMYEYEFRSLYNLIEREIKNSNYDIKRLTKRLADWVPPTK